MCGCICVMHVHTCVYTYMCVLCMKACQCKCREASSCMCTRICSYGHVFVQFASLGVKPCIPFFLCILAAYTTYRKQS